MAYQFERYKRRADPDRDPDTKHLSANIRNFYTKGKMSLNKEDAAKHLAASSYWFRQME